LAEPEDDEQWDEDQEIQQFREFLDHLNPEDFES
jgi:hypothetical protein